MARNPFNLVQWLGVSLVTLLFAACSGDSTMKALLEQVSGNADYVVVGNSTNVIESLGGSIEDKTKIVLPKNIADELPATAEKALEDANDELKDMGVDISGCAVFGSYEDANNPTLVVAINDEDKFDKYIKDEYDGNDYEDEDNGFTLYSTGEKSGHHIAVYKGYAYIFDRYEENKEARHTARKLFNSIDEDGSFADSNFADYIVDGNAFGAVAKLPKVLRDVLKLSGVPSSVANLYSGAVCMRGSVDGDELTIDVKLLDKEGNDVDTDALKELYDLDARISADALAYMGKNEVAVFACALKDFKLNKYLDPILNSGYIARDEAAAISMVKGFLNKIDGTIAFGIGVNKGLESFAAIDANAGEEGFKQISTTIVVEMRDDKAKALVNDLKSTMKQNSEPYTDTSDGFCIDIAEFGVKVYAKAEGNMLIFANHAIEKKNENPAVKALDFTDYISAGAVALSKDNKLMKDLGITNDVLLSCTTNVEKWEATLKLKVSGSEGVLANIAQMVVGLIDRSSSLGTKYDTYREKYRPTYTDYYNPHAYDSTAVEEDVPVEPDEYIVD